MKRIIPFILLLTLCLTSCGKNVNDEEKAGTAENIENPQTTWYYKEEQSAYEKPEPVVEPEGSYGRLMDYSEMGNGEIYFLYWEDLTPEQEKNYYKANGPRTDAEYANHIIRYDDAESSFEEVNLEIDSDIFLCNIQVSEDGTIILFDWNRAYVYLPGEEQCKTDFPADPRGGTIFQDDTHLICQSMMDSAYMVFDLKTGEKTEDYISREFLLESGGNGGCFLAEDCERQLLVTASGIYEREGEEWVLKVSSERTSIGLRGFSPDGLWKEDEEYYITDETTLYRYYLAEREAEEQVELKIFSASENLFLKEAVVQYQVTHPNVNITYEFVDNKEPADRQEMDVLLKRVNTEIVSDQAADIYVLDKLPWQEYMKKGFLANIDEVVNTYLGTGEYFDGVLSAYQEHDETLAVPLFFKADCFVCQKELTPYIGSLAELAEYLKEHPDEAGLVPYNYKGNIKGFFLPMLYHFYGNELYEDGKVTKERLEAFLENAKIIYDRLENNQEGEKPYYPVKYDHFFDNYVLDEMWQFLGCGIGEVSLYIVGDRNVIATPQIYHYDDFKMISNGQFHPVMLMGMHIRTKYPEEACDFLRFLISYATVYSERDNRCCNDMGIPLSKQTIGVWLERWRERNIETYDQGFYYDRNYGEGYPVYFPEEGDDERLMEILDQASIPRGYANYLTDSVYAVLVQGIDGYFEGEKSLDRTVDELYSKISLKQSEER